MFQIFASDLGTVGLSRPKQACAGKFLATVTEGVVHGVYKVVTRSSVGVIQRHTASGGTWTVRHCDTRSYLDLVVE